MDEERKAQLGITTRTANDPVLNRAGFTRAELQTALDLNLPLATVNKVLETYTDNVKEFIKYDREVKNGRVS